MEEVDESRDYAQSSLSDSSRDRAAQFYFFSQVLLCPDKIFKKKLADGSLEEEVMQLINYYGDTMLETYVAEHYFHPEDPAEIEHIFSSLRKEYTRLFLADPLISLYGSAYYPYYFEEQTTVKKIMQDSGLKLAEDSRDSADHIAYEFEYLYYLSFMEYRSWNAGDPENAHEWKVLCKDFWDIHVLEFAGEFSRALAAETRVNFYLVVAKLFKDLLLNKKLFLG